MGNPHVVIFEDHLEGFPIARYGPAIETHKAFPQRTNVHFVRVCNNGEIFVRTWERGAGLTRACGTGACATAVAAIKAGRVQSPVTVALPGGELLIDWAPGGSISMSGPAAHVFTGEADGL